MYVDGANRFNSASPEHDGAKADKVKSANSDEQRSVRDSVTEQKSCNDSKDGSPDRSPEPDESGNCTDEVQGEYVRRQSHHQSGPGLLCEKCDAEQDQS